MEARRIKGAQLDMKIKGVLRQRKEELLKRQKTLRQVENLTQEGDLL